MSLGQDIDRLAKTLRNIRKNAVPQADAAALKKAANRIKSRVTKDVTGEVQVQQKHVRKRIYTKVKVTRDFRRGRVTAYRRDIPAIRLGVAASMVRRIKGQRLISQASRDTKGRFTKRQYAGHTAIRIGRTTYPNAFINQVQGDNWQIMRRKTNKRYPVEVIVVKIAPTVDRFLPRRSKEIMASAYPGLLEHELDWRIKRYASKS